MLRFKQYTQLQEAINQAQRDRLGIPDDEPTPNARKLTKGIIPEGEDHVRIPLTNNTKEKVRDHLEKHGYELSDYNKGEAKDKHGRIVSVAGILKNKKTEAPAELTKGFENDDRKSEITPETHDIHITANRGDVATSGANKRWPISCRNIGPKGLPTKYGKGAAARCIKAELEGGSVAAFLQKKGDHNPDNAEARIMMHRYDHRDANGNIIHSVLMPERKVYSVGGGKQSDFQTSLEDYMRKKTPMIPGNIYRKNEGAYNDDNEDVRANTSPESIKKILLGNDANYKDKEDLTKSIKLPPKTISSVLNEPQTNSNYENLRHAHRLIARHQKLSDEHFNHLLDNGHIEHLSSNYKLTKGQVKKIANYKQTPSTSGDSELDHVVNKSLSDSLATAHSNIIKNHHDKLGSDDIHSILDSNAEHEEMLKKEGRKSTHGGPISAMAYYNDALKLKPEHIEKIKKSINPASTDLTGESDEDFSNRTQLGITPEDSKKDIHSKLSKILDQPDSDLTRTQKLAALDHKDITPEHISKGLDSTNPSIAHAAIRNKIASPENISKALKHPEVSVNLEAAKHRNNNEDTINHGLNRGEMVARESMENEKATTGNILNGLKHKSPRVALAAAEHQNNDENTINSALDPKNHLAVRTVAAHHENATPKNISKGLNDEWSSVASAAVRNKNASPENISKALNHEDSVVRLSAMNHENATPEHYKMATNDPEASIRVKARNLLNQAKPNSYSN